MLITDEQEKGRKGEAKVFSPSLLLLFGLLSAAA
jgi:hypothetical protein